MSYILIFQLAGILITALFFLLLKTILAPKYSFSDFIKGVNQGYSLSKFQAVLWAVVIISFQVSTIVLCVYEGKIFHYKLLFPQDILWLLGLSLTSYITVKGIMESKPLNTVSTRNTPHRSDLITNGNELDFSKFQMLIWTVIAVLAYEVACYDYLGLFYKTGNTFESLLSEECKYLPTIDTSFVVLMGLSHGAYLGKKLIKA